jgi:hypothetical protein
MARGRKAAVTTITVIAALISTLALSIFLLNEGKHRTRLRVPVYPIAQSLIGFDNTGKPAPWPKGNYLTIHVLPLWYRLPIVRDYLLRRNTINDIGERFSVINMHAENYQEIVKQLNLRSVEIQKLPQGQCLIVDAQIPQSWLLATPPKWVDPTIAAQYPHCFAPPRTHAAPPTPTP